MQRELAALGSPAEVVRRYLEYVAPRDEDERGFVIALMINALQEAVIADPSPDPAHPGSRRNLPRRCGAVRTVQRDLLGLGNRSARRSSPVTAEIVLQVGNAWYLSSIAGLRHPDPDLLRSTIDTLVALVVGSRS